MCGRFTIVMGYEFLIERYEAEVAQIHNFSPNYNAAPTQLLPVIINGGTNNRLGVMRWGLIPSWAKDPKIAYKMINARAETITEKPAFRGPIRHKRCIIPADSIFEWKREGARKQPFRITMKTADVFSMAGVYDTWKDADGSLVHTFSIITTEPNEFMSEIHDRMPVILRPEDEGLWLDRNVAEPEMLLHLLKPYSADKMRAYPVSPRVGNVKNNDAQLIEEIPM